MNDPWWWAAIGGSVGVGAAIREIAKAGAAFFRSRERARKSDAEVGFELREELRADLNRLRSEVADLRVRAEECEAHARECREENEQLRKHAEELAERVGQLEARQ